MKPCDSTTQLTRSVALAAHSNIGIKSKIVRIPYPDLNLILIGGASHVGKSTIAALLATSLDWKHISTDSLARHPGRPWRSAPEKVPDDVAEHYLYLSVDELIEDVLRHYRVNVWPQVKAIIASQLSNPSATGIVLEGSALWPEFATSLDFEKISAIWLVATDELFRQRIHAESQYNSKSPREQMMIRKFLERTIAFNALMVDAANLYGFTLLDVQHSNVSELAERCLSIMAK